MKQTKLLSVIFGSLGGRGGGGGTIHRGCTRGVPGKDSAWGRGDIHRIVEFSILQV